MLVFAPHAAPGPGSVPGTHAPSERKTQLTLAGRIDNVPRALHGAVLLPGTHPAGMWGPQQLPTWIPLLLPLGTQQTSLPCMWLCHVTRLQPMGREQNRGGSSTALPPGPSRVWNTDTGPPHSRLKGWAEPH